jgi:hypothetical protein
MAKFLLLVIVHLAMSSSGHRHSRGILEAILGNGTDNGVHSRPTITSQAVNLSMTTSTPSSVNSSSLVDQLLAIASLNNSSHSGHNRVTRTLPANLTDYMSALNHSLSANNGSQRIESIRLPQHPLFMSNFLSSNSSGSKRPMRSPLNSSYNEENDLNVDHDGQGDENADQTDAEPDAGPADADQTDAEPDAGPADQDADGDADGHEAEGQDVEGENGHETEGEDGQDTQPIREKTTTTVRPTRRPQSVETGYVYPLPKPEMVKQVVKRALVNVTNGSAAVPISNANVAPAVIVNVLIGRSENATNTTTKCPHGHHTHHPIRHQQSRPQQQPQPQPPNAIRLPGHVRTVRSANVTNSTASQALNFFRFPSSLVHSNSSNVTSSTTSMPTFVATKINGTQMTQLDDEADEEENDGQSVVHEIATEDEDEDAALPN